MSASYADSSHQPEPTIEVDVVRRVIHELKDNKSPGWDGISAELLKASREEGIRMLTVLC